MEGGRESEREILVELKPARRSDGGREGGRERERERERERQRERFSWN